MASTPFDPSHLGANPFDIFNDAAAVKNQAPLLPGGACNFVDLSPGANGARCGCRRFWSRCGASSVSLDQTHWCMCNHHACYHEDGGREDQLLEPHGPNQENERPRTGREPLSPVTDPALKTPATLPGMDFASFISPGGALSFIHNNPEEASPDPRTSQSPRPGSSMPDTLCWGNLVQPCQGSNALPPIPSQCLMASQAPSTTSSAHAKYLRPFAGKGLNTLSNASGPKPSPLQNKPQEPPPPPSPALRTDSYVLVSQEQAESQTPYGDTLAQPKPPAQQPSQATVSRRAFKNLADTVSGHEQRLDRLETVSFSVAGHDECQDKLEHTDVRITELESRVEEVEKMVNDNGSVVSRPGRNDDASVVSEATNNTARPTHSQELYSQVQSLQNQVIQLQALIPSASNPWEVEVVFLPFPLKKVWQEGHQFKHDPSVSSDEWTQLPMTLSSTTMRSQSPFYGDWVNPDHDAPWLFPKACGDKSIVDQRLRSRGLVKHVMVKGSDARSVNLAMSAAFSSTFREMQICSRAQALEVRSASFLGLQSAWIPLRKIHKDSRLRFLSPAEMVTPATWDVQFLNSVMMRSSEPRLFVTHPDAYLQDYQAYETGWTWQKLKEMSRVGLNDSMVPETLGFNKEECWSWNELLDNAPPVQASISSRPDRRTASTSPSQPYFPAVEVFRSSSPGILARAPSPILKGRRGSRPPHIRTSSMPISGPMQESPVSARRRVASYGQSRRSSPILRTSSQAAIMKRRRTRSPSHPRFTPRWTASPSPAPLGISDRQTARGTTPFAYATPFSNAPLQEVRPMRSSSVVHNLPTEASDEEDSDFEIESYQSDSDNYNDEEEIRAVEIIEPAQPNLDFDSQRWHFGDELWLGIEDQDQISNGENIDPCGADNRSDGSSQPSEYPSTQSAWPAENPLGFQIHEDDDNKG